MNYTINRQNPKEPENANPPNPHIVNHFVSPPSETTISKTLTDLITQSVDPDILEKIRELDNSNQFPSTTQQASTSTIPNAKPLPLNGNPLREKSGLLYRDILKNADNVRVLGDASNRSMRHK